MKASPVRMTIAAAMLAGLPVDAATLRCPVDSVKVGTACVDKYEASVWQIPAANRSLVKRVQVGKATLAELSAGATQVSPTAGCTPPFPATFPVNGMWTAPLYAASIPGVLPTACVTWFQAAQLCALSGKRLATNQEWQRAAAGTPDTDDEATLCNVGGPPFAPTQTGARPSCVSQWGASDMVGNVWEWVGDWDEMTTTFCQPRWPAEFGGDVSCLAGPGGTETEGPRHPGMVKRGGNWNTGAGAGVFAIGSERWTTATALIGFRCAR